MCFKKVCQMLYLIRDNNWVRSQLCSSPMQPALPCSQLSHAASSPMQPALPCSQLSHAASSPMQPALPCSQLSHAASSPMQPAFLCNQLSYATSSPLFHAISTRVFWVFFLYAKKSHLENRPNRNVSHLWIFF